MAPVQWIARGLLLMAAWYGGMLYNTTDGAKKLAYLVVAIAALIGMVFVALQFQPTPPK